MRYTLVISLVLHSTILLAAIFGLSLPEEHKVKEQKSVQVDIVEIKDVSKRQAQVKLPPLPKVEQKPKPKIKVEPKITKIETKKLEKKIKQAAKKPEPKPVKKPKPVAKLEPVAEEKPPEPEKLEELIKKTEEAAEPLPDQKKVKKLPRPKIKPKPPKKFLAKQKKKRKKKNQLDEVAALLNKIDDTKQAPPPPDDAGEPLRGLEEVLRGKDDAVSASELDWLRQKIGLCWNIPAGVRDAEALVVRVQFELDPDGHVKGLPAVLNNINHPAFPAAARSAVGAIMSCQPYSKLPVEKYDSWKIIRMNFDPSKMLAIN